MANDDEASSELPTGSRLTALDEAFRSDPYVILNRLRSRDPIHRDEELKRWFITDHDLVPGLRAARGEGADHVVRLVAGQLEDRDAVGVEDLTNVADLGREVVGHRHPVGLVLGVGLVPLGPLGPVPGDGHEVGGVLAEELPQHGREAVDRVGRFSSRGREALDRVVGPVDVRHRVDQVELSRVGHERAILWPRKSRGRQRRKEA